ncbi:hypothetical protein ACFPVT_02540 [Corynebacterium choanae]|uniref:Uncharacterized protein n=1 Tax=Corynebacterium choanae TaxID=1862358 RepID=A0A3G6J560_9CORY|nr:hypothetical protein [Corynebacterium choanae]AZA12883.1 hypothetical protein CCHOA_02330 [Corynebacterium choanae]
MQQLLTIIAGLMTAFGLLINLVSTVPALFPLRETVHAPLATPSPLWPMIVAPGDGSVIVNGLTLNLSMAQARAIALNFPIEGERILDETGRVLTRFEYRQAYYYFDGDVLCRIRLPRTPEGISTESTFVEATNTYGSPVHAYKSGNGRYYAAFTAASIYNTAWIVEFDYSSGAITSLWQANNLNDYLDDAAKAKQAKAIEQALHLHR